MNDFNSVLTAAQELPEPDRLRLIDALWETVSPDSEVPFSDDWSREIERRVAELDAGRRARRQHLVHQPLGGVAVGDGDPMDICVLTEKHLSHGDILLQAIPILGMLIYLIARDEVDDVMDGFVYGAICGLGFAIVEALLIPFAVRGRAVGTLWLLSHDETLRFDAEAVAQ